MEEARQWGKSCSLATKRAAANHGGAAVVERSEVALERMQRRTASLAVWAAAWQEKLRRGGVLEQGDAGDGVEGVRLGQKVSTAGQGRSDGCGDGDGD